MAFTALTVTTGKRSGQAVTAGLSDETNGNTIAIEGNEVVRIKNNGASPYTVTFNSIKLSDFGTDANETVTIAAGATVVCGPFRTDRWRNGSGLMELTYSAGTSTNLSIEVLRAKFGQPDSLSI